MGSPDKYGRQLNGMGSGVSSTSKICVVERSSRPDADLDYTFVQVGIKDGSLDVAGNCGNMSSVVAPWALGEGLLRNVHELDRDGVEDGEINVSIFNTNTSKLITVTCKVTEDGSYDPFGDYSIDGVPGVGSRITMSFQDPAGAKTGKTLPTGNAVDTLKIGGWEIQASLVDVANPGVFVRAEDIGVAGDIDPTALEEKTEIMARLEQIRQEGARLMGLDPLIQTIPKIVLISEPTRAAAAADGTHIVCRALSMQQPHKAVPLTLALNLGASVRIPGTLPASIARDAENKQSITIAHAGGKIAVGSVFEDGRIKSALLYRTARILMKGDVYYTADA